MRVLIIGALGLIGRRVLLQRLALGDEVTVMTRDRRRTRRMLVALGLTNIPIVEGDPAIPGPWQEAVDGHDVVMMLAGAGIADRRWSNRYLRTIRESRIDGTYQVVQAIDRVEHRPELLMTASAVGYYGDRGRVLTDEYAAAGDDELADICVEWENQAIRAEPLCRVVRLRFGVVLDASGGALAKMLPIFRKGLGGRLGSGRQYMSWITWSDLVGAVDHLLQQPDAAGAYNIVTPNAVTNREFTETLAGLLRRPAVLPVPGPALRIAVGRIASTLLSGQRAWPARLMESNYQFQHPEIGAALSSVLNLKPPPRKTVQVPASQLPEPPARPRLVVVDIDGLLPDALNTRTALQQLSSSGAQVVLASCEGIDSSRRFLHRCGQSFPMIVSDGAVVLSRGGEMIVASRALPRELVESLLEEGIKLDEALEFTFETLEGESLRFSTDGRTNADFNVPNTVLRIRVSGAESPRVRFETAIRERFWKSRRIAIHQALDETLEIIHPHSDRGIAVQEVARRLGVPREMVLAIVSSDRSAGLAEWSGFAVALSEASATIQGLADITTDASSVDGISEAHQKWIHQQDPQTVEQP